MSEKIMLIDGNSLINRAFYAMPLLTNKDGEYTSAVYGFLNIFFKLYDEEKPKYVGVCFDLPKPTFRHIKYDQYKGTRKSMPEELRPQIPTLKKVLTAMGIRIYELEGFEADDVLATLANRACEAGLMPTIVSGDRDLLQVASESIKIKIPKTKGGSTIVEEYYAEDVLEHYGVTPKEFIEVKALMGDTSDNVPGVPSIGEKTATKIIQQYKNVEAAIANAENIKPKKASENLIEFKEQALLSKFLVTIDTNVPVEFKVEDVKAEDIFNQTAYEMFKQYEFKSMINRFEKTAIKNVITQSVDYKYIQDEAQANNYISQINPFCECAYSLIIDEGELVAISISNAEQRGCVIALEESRLLKVFKDFFEGDTPKIGHDVKSDITFLKRRGIDISNIIFDTSIAGYLLNSSKDNYEYNEIAQDFLNESYLSEEEIVGKGKSRKKYSELSQNDFIELCARKSDISFRTMAIMDKLLEEKGEKSLYYDIELPLTAVLAEMEINGIGVDKKGLIEYRDKLETKIDELTKDIYWLAGEEFNINSPKQLSVILFEKLGLKGGKKTKTGWSTSADVLEKIKGDDEIVNKVLKYRTYVKLKSTYADGLLNVMDEKTSRIYSTFNQTITTTGRISSTEPNLQNIPIKLELGRELRKVFVAREGFTFVDGDYSQIELRVLAHMAEDETLINAFKEGQDIHRLTASQVFNVPFDEVTALQRSNAKAVNFGIVYGIGAFSLGHDLGITRKEAEKYIEGYFEKYPKVKEYMNSRVEEAKKNGYATTIFGRRRFIPEINSSNFVQRGFGERVAMNMPVQGSAADIIKIAMVKVYNRLKKEKLNSKLILQVHDELLIEADLNEVEAVRSIMIDEMVNAVKLSVPMEVDVHEGKTWYEAK